MFSQGIEPSHVEGGQHTINDGRVSFRTLDNVAPGSETVFKIHAKATASGTHVFRADASGVAIPDVLPDEYRALAQYGFDLAAYFSTQPCGAEP